ncbi:hypothetical protein AEAC466_06580 [Asticcacaulis sp. AC466]|uniref:hypothetical protein n=1 Tax=Asticcacaulis sp. AC466 TaxID=1282362 RepID=UPI0003C40CAF|nr:hypothetical protein [Asticcacaulis sp. AC466]ESQ84715.1 hypothetical protein AEAC466_06580 [Asticcacaulis sp. AC466]
MDWGLNLITGSIIAALFVWLIAVLAHRAYRDHYFTRTSSTWRKPGFWENFSLRHAVSADIFQSDDDVAMTLYARVVLAGYRVAIVAFYCLLFADLLFFLIHLSA